MPGVAILFKEMDSALPHICISIAPLTRAFVIIVTPAVRELNQGDCAILPYSHRDGSRRHHGGLQCTSRPAKAMRAA